MSDDALKQNNLSEQGDAATAEPTPRERGKELGRVGKFLIGGLGAMTPIVMSLAIIDVSLLSGFWQDVRTAGFDAFDAIGGYLIRAIFLFLLGGIWVWMHSSVKDRVKAFELGIVAPAMIVGILNANNAKIESPASDGQSQAHYVGRVMIVPASYVEKSHSGTKPSTIKCIVKGFLGQRCR